MCVTRLTLRDMLFRTAKCFVFAFLVSHPSLTTFLMAIRMFPHLLHERFLRPTYQYMNRAYGLAAPPSKSVSMNTINYMSRKYEEFTNVRVPRTLLLVTK